MDITMSSYSRLPPLYLFHRFQPPAFFFSSTLFKYVIMSKGQSSSTLFEIRQAIFRCLTMLKYAAIFKCAQTSKWQSSSTLASFSLLADYSSVKLPTHQSSCLVKPLSIIFKSPQKLSSRQTLSTYWPRDWSSK